MHFIKMHGIGNDYIYVDRFLYDAPRDVDAAAVKVSDRHTGIGSDGLILIEPSEVADCRMNMRNADGSVSKMCGNAMRCIGKYMLERHPERCHGDVVRIETLGGIKAVQAVERDENGAVTLLRVDMEAPGFAAESIPVLAENPQDVPLHIGDKPARGVCVSMGNPHVVFLMDEDPMGLEPFDRIGRPIEFDAAFPERTNVEFVQPLPDGSLSMRVWERGSGETMACGTGACASAVAAMLKGAVAAREVTVHLRGGDLTIEWNEADGRVYMTGPAAYIAEGEWMED